jgi:predicted XRE-type DNA-binding protein
MAKDKIEFEMGSGNVFADLDLPDADLLLAKARLVAALEDIAAKENLSQTDISRISGTTQPRISKMLSGKGRGYTLDSVCKVFISLGYPVSIHPAKAKSKDAKVVVKAK